MTRDEAREAAEVLQHYADGGNAEVRWNDGEWFDISGCGLPRVRIKQKPAEGWGTIGSDNDLDTLLGYASEKHAQLNADACRRIIHWREVTP